MNVLHCLVGLLPELHLDGSVQLSQPGVQVPLLSLWVSQVDGVGCWILLLDDQVQMISQLVTQLTELSLALVLQTESEEAANNS